MLDHVTVKVGDFARAQAFYDLALKPLGLSPLAGDDANIAGYGSDGAVFWIGAGQQTGGTHVAFTALNRATVDAFHAAAMAGGGRDNGAPGIRAQYEPNYYGAFVFDPDGHNVEAVCRTPA